MAARSTRKQCVSLDKEDGTPMTTLEVRFEVWTDNH